MLKPDKQFRVLLLVALVVLPGVISTTAFAQFTVSPIIIEVRAYAGGVRTFTLSIGNSGPEPLDCTISVSAMAVMGGGLPVEVEDAPRSCKDWITVNPDKFTLRPKEGKRLICRARIPKKTGGGYYAIISCHGVPMGGSDERTAESGVGAGIEFSHRSLVPVLLTIPGPQMQAIMEAAMPIIRSSQGGRGYTLDLPVRNRGNIHARMGGTVEVRSEAGQLIERFELAAGRGFVLPEHERLFTSKVPVNLADGVYVAHIRLEVENSRQPMRNSFPFYIEDGEPNVTEITDELRAKLEKQSAGFTVSPVQMLVAVRPGARRSQAVELVNLTGNTIHLQATLMEWHRTPNGQNLVSDEKPPHGRSGRALVDLRLPEIELRPLGRRRIPIMVAVPKDATGERYVALTFDRADLQLDTSPAARTRRSVMIRAYAQGTGTTGAEITRFEATRKPNGVIDLSVRFRNTGDIGISPEAAFTISDENGRQVGKVKPTAGSPFVQAGCEGVISAEYSRVLDPGEYTAELTFRADRNKPPVTRRTGFVVPSASESVAKETPTGVSVGESKQRVVEDIESKEKEPEPEEKPAERDKKVE